MSAETETRSCSRASTDPSDISGSSSTNAATQALLETVKAVIRDAVDAEFERRVQQQALTPAAHASAYMGQEIIYAAPATYSDPTLKYLWTLFPTVETKELFQVTNHELRGADFYKLSSDYMEGIDYPTPHSLIIPLLIYFQILAAHAFASGYDEPESSHLISRYTSTYFIHLTWLIGEYEWPAVLRYHMDFYAKRRHEMASGIYSNWETVDENLFYRYVGGRYNDTGRFGAHGASSCALKKRIEPEVVALNLLAEDIS
ncbi:hypothetical protein SISNIDRAFT_487797 [Sistotremastrum niveocremeum HHB9708]|uniref:Uncharacterized protein n=1 Tax=Sistotremastrum niveocremeum HHB9708 TaxID=1314777 RepID=A0A164S2U6_9AGAM|nr:hypothetical protein SISNIDRAFT_487797 [Sistotremastrum niveocremeum HHB9708]